MRRLLAAAAALALAAAPAAAQDEADRAWAAGDTDRAAALYEARLAADSTDAAALHRLALVRAWNERYDASLALFDRLLALDPANREARLDRVRVLAWAGRHDAAVAGYEAMLAEDPADVDALLGMGTVLGWAGRLPAAEAAYARALAAAPDHVEALRGQARVAAWGGRLVEAERRWRAVVGRHPGDAAGWVGLSQTLRWQGRDAPALAAAERAIALAPGDRDAAEALRWARAAVAPRASSSLALEEDSDGNDIVTAAAGAALRPLPALEVRADGYLRDAGDDVGVHATRGWTAGARLQVEPGWNLAAGVGASHPAMRDPIAAYRASVSTPGRYPATATLAFSRHALDATRLLVEREVYVRELGLTAGWAPAPGWTLNGGAGGAAFVGRVSGEENRRWNANASAARRVSAPFALAATVRGFGFERDLADGYFDPDLYLLGEVAARWNRALGRWAVAAEAAPGVQRIGREGETGGAFRGTGTVAYEAGPGRRVALTAVVANSGMQQLSPGAGDGYRYRAVTLAAGWVF